VQAGAAEWLPQETILFDRCAAAIRVELPRMRGFSEVSLVFSRAAWARSWNEQRCAMS
jgi:hypothetical protein